MIHWDEAFLGRKELDDKELESLVSSPRTDINRINSRTTLPQWSQHTSSPPLYSASSLIQELWYGTFTLARSFKDT